MKRPKVVLGGLRKSENTLFARFIRQDEIRDWVRLLLWTLSAGTYSKEVYILVDRIHDLWTKSGPKLLVLYLKECTRLLQQYLSGNPSKSSMGGVLVKTHKGLPTIIPTPLRSGIRDSNVVIIRVLSTVFSLYRIIYVKPVLKLSTITDGFKGDPGYRLPMIPSVLRFFRLSHKALELKTSKSLKTGPNQRFSLLGSAADASAWILHPKLLISYIRLSGWWKWGYLFSLLLIVVGVLSYPFQLRSGSKFRLGRLGQKVEAAGKIRVFAMTDWWTQSLLLSLHDKIYLKLRHIREDGTMDQVGPLKRLSEIGRGRPAFSFDLTAATDRIPCNEQAELLNHLIGPGFGDLWSKVLVGRDWYLKEDPLRYGVGQPMGAYSSFGMLAMIHHYIVQLAAYNEGHRHWFGLYALLGDDIVIADKAVATSYLSIMKSLGVDINLTKSLQSEGGTFEFAKRLVSPIGELTPVGASNLLVSLRRWGMIPNLLIDIMNKGVYLTPTIVSRMMDNIRHSVNIKKKDVLILRLMIIGPLGVFRTGGTEMIFSIPFSYQTLTPAVLDSLIYGFMAIKIKELKSAILTSKTQAIEFFRMGIKDVTQWLNPGFWIAARALEKSYTLYDSLDYSHIMQYYMKVVGSGYAQIGWEAFTDLVSKFEIPRGFSLDLDPEDASKEGIVMRIKAANQLRREFRLAIKTIKITVYPVVPHKGDPYVLIKHVIANPSLYRLARRSAGVGSLLSNRPTGLTLSKELKSFISRRESGESVET